MTPLIERDASDTTQVVYTKNPLSLGGIGGLISSIQPALPAAEHIPDVALDRGMVLNVIFNTYYYHDSNLGNVNQITDSSGTVIQTYDYDSFGNIVNQSGSLTQAYQYKTKEYSPDTGLVFFGARYYNPLIGRFITKDPSGMVDGPNLYVYLNNDPINKYDPWGLDTVNVITRPVYRYIYIGPVRIPVYVGRHGYFKFKDGTTASLNRHNGRTWVGREVLPISAKEEKKWMKTACIESEEKLKEVIEKARANDDPNKDDVDGKPYDAINPFQRGTNDSNDWINSRLEEAGGEPVLNWKGGWR